MQPQYITLPKQAKDITGQRFGRLVALGPTGRNKRRQIEWLCNCDCGNTTTVASGSLIDGNTSSCGCLKIEITIRNNTTHGMSQHPIIRTWRHMIARCSNPTDHDYPAYGARGIRVCEEWAGNIKAFHDYVSSLPNYKAEGYTLDRIDNDGNYEPGNVRWATQAQQNRNTRKSKIIVHNGESKCLSEWARDTGIHIQTLRRRIKLGWPTEKLLTQQPLRHIP